MRNPLLSRRTPNDLSTADVASWLRSADWIEVATEGSRCAIFEKHIDQDVARVEVPLSRSLGDYRLRMSEVVTTVSVVEERPVEDILREMVRSCADLLTLRLVGGAADAGKITAESGATLYQRVRDLLLAGACAAVQKRPLFARRKPDQAMGFLRHARILPPEPGSFTVLVESPVAAQLQSGLVEDDVESPFERRALQTLSTGLAAAVDAAEQASVSQNADPFVRAVSAGVTANLCEALVGILRAVEGSRLDAGFAWSRNRSVPIGAPRLVTVPSDLVPILEAAAREFRVREPMAEFALTGTILELASPDPERGGTLTVGGFLDERAIRVRVDVGGKVYAAAGRAHQAKRFVSLEGELEKDGRSFILKNPRDFAIVTDD